MINNLKVYILIAMSLFFISCEMKEDKGNFINGRVVLENNSRNIKISIYEAKDINDTLFSIMNRYPSIGTKVTKNHLFDFNNEEPIKSTYTDKNGNWEITDLVEGKYHILYNKDGFVSFDYDINVSNGENALKNKSFVSPIVFADTTISGNVKIKPFSNIIIKGGLVVDEFSSLEIGEGCNIAMFDSSSKLGFDKASIKVLEGGELLLKGSKDNFIKVYGANGNKVNSKEIWSGIKVGSGAKGVFRYCEFFNGREAVFYLKSKVDVENCVFFNCEQGLGFEMNKSGNCNRNIFLACNTGLSGVKIDSFDIKDNIYYGNRKGAFFYGLGSCDFRNSMVCKNYIGLSNIELFSGIVHECNFVANDIIPAINSPELKPNHCSILFI